MTKDRRELPPYLSEEWFKLHRHLSGGPLAGRAVINRWRANEWNSAFIREGDEWFKPALSEHS